MTINEMIQKRAKVWETAKNFVDTHENENGVLSAEDSAAYERMEQEIEDLTARRVSDSLHICGVKASSKLYF